MYKILITFHRNATVYRSKKEKGLFPVQFAVETLLSGTVPFDLKRISSKYLHWCIKAILKSTLILMAVQRSISGIQNTIKKLEFNVVVLV